MELSTVAARIKFARQQKGLSRRDVASRLSVDVTAVAAWETGRYMPRDAHRAALSRLLDVDLTALLEHDVAEAAFGISASIVQGSKQGRVLAELARSCRGHLTIIRVASPFVTAKHQMREFRQIASERILDHTLDVRLIEVFYDPQRLREVVWNVFRYSDCSYQVKTFSFGKTDVFPGLDAYIFDNSIAVLCSYWATSVTDERPVLQVTGEPFATFVREHWNEVWRRARLLNPYGADDLSAFQEFAASMGDAGEDWERFVDSARHLDIGDDAPPSP